MSTDNKDMKKKGLYNVTDLVDFIIEKYHLSKKPDFDTAKATYRQKIVRTLKDLDLWDKGIDFGDKKKKTKYFTEHQKQMLLTEKSMYNYLREHSTLDLFKKSKRYNEIEKEISRRQEEYLNDQEALYSYMENKKNDNYAYIDESKFRSIENHLMIKALFEKFFTPIDENLLRDDLNQIINKEESDLTFRDIEAEHRLCHPEGNYYYPISQKASNRTTS